LFNYHVLIHAPWIFEGRDDRLLAASLKGDLEARTYGVRELRQRPGRWNCSTRFQASDIALRCSHALGYFLLRQTCAAARLSYGCRQCAPGIL
jgi:hypothetical protein